MSKDIRHFFENGLPGQDLIALLERAICEGVYAPAAAEAPAHLFGRSCARESLPALSGMAASGLRTAAFFDPAGLARASWFSKQMSRQHIPLVAHVNGIPAQEPAGFFQVVATSLQEAADWTLMARKIAELSLVPGLVIYQGAETGKVSLLHNNDLRTFLGEVEDWLPSPTPAQRIAFGKSRRRIPAWFHYDVAAMLGGEKDERGAGLEAAARERFFFRHLPELIAQVKAEFASFTGRAYESISAHRMRDAEYAVLVIGASWQTATQAVEQLRGEKIRAGALHLNVLDPFPEKELSELLSGKKALAVLEPLQGERVGESRLLSRVRAAVARCGKQAPMVYSGAGLEILSPESIAAAVRNMTPKGAQRQRFLLDIEYTRGGSPASPQREALLHAISREYPGIGDESLDRKAPANEPGARARELPAQIRRHKDMGPLYSKVSRFYHDTAVFYQSGAGAELTADPFQALPLLPPETALFEDQPPRRENLPALDAELCTGCGACFVHCPHSALPSLSLNLENLLRGAMQIASATALTPMIKNLARLSAQEIAASGKREAKPSEFLPKAFDDLAAQMKLEGEKLDNARRGLEGLLSVLEGYQGIAADAFFGKAEELFSLTINPQTCTGCGLCAEICPEGALSLVPQTPGLIEDYSRRMQLWEQLPDTGPDTILRLNADPDYDSFASLLLSRYFYQTMPGASATETAAPAKTLLRLLTAIAESSAQPRVLEWVKELDELGQGLAANIQGKLSKALPGQDSAELRSALLEAGGKKMSLDELIGKAASVQPLQALDTALLQRKIALESNLKDMRWALTDGPSGTGRARYGIALFAEELPGLMNYPWQPFQTPVWVAPEGAGIGQAEGLMESQARYLLDQIRLVRRARMEIKDAYRPEIHDRQIASLTWEDLEEREKALLPPLLIVADLNRAMQSEQAAMLRMLNSDWPFKFVLLNEGAAENAGAEGLLFSAMNLRKPFVAQGNLAAPEVLYASLMKAMQTKGALLHLLAPRLDRHSTPLSQWHSLFKKALETRAFPVWQFEPRPDMAYFSQGFSLKGNPAEAAPFSNWLETLRDGKDADRLEREALRQWDTWRELAGVLSATPASVRADAEREMQKKHEADIKALKAEYEQKLKEQEAGAMEQARMRLRDNLLILSNKGIKQ